MGSSFDLKSHGVKSWGWVLVMGIVNAVLGLMMIANNLPGGIQEAMQGRKEIADGYKQIGAAGADVFKDTLNSLVDVNVEVDGLLNDLYEAYTEGTVPGGVLPEEVAQLLEFKNELEGWVGKFEEGYETAISAIEAGTSGDACAIFTFIEENADTVLDKMPKF